MAKCFQICITQSILGSKFHREKLFPATSTNKSYTFN